MADVGLPRDREAEEAVIAASLVDPAQIPALSAEVEPAHFYDERNRWVFEATLAVYERDGPAGVNTITIARELEARRRLEDAVGPAYLSRLTTDLPTAVGAHNYARIVREKYVRRLVIDKATSAVRMAHDPGQSLETVLSALSTSAQDLTRHVVKDGPVSLRQILHELAERPPLPERGVLTPWPSLNYVLGPMAAGRVIVIAARPSVGKSSLAINLFHDVVSHGQKRALYVSLEMGRDEIGLRVLANETGIDSKRLESGVLSDAEERRVSAAQGALSEALAWVHADVVDAEGIEVRAKEHQLREGLDLLIIDYLQLMEVKKRESRYEIVTEASRRMKKLARDLQVPIVLLSQLSRNLESRADRRPQLSDLRETGAIEQDADAVLMLHDPREDNVTQPDRPYDLQVLLRKNRMGMTLGGGQPVRLRFYPSLCRFDDVSVPQEADD